MTGYSISFTHRESLISEQGLSGLAPSLPEAPDADSGGGGGGQEQAEADRGQHCGEIQPQQRGEAGARADPGTGLVLAMTTVRGSVTNQVLADADVGVTGERISAAKVL